jgi:hypothetical protein
MSIGRDRRGVQELLVAKAAEGTSGPIRLQHASPECLLVQPTPNGRRDVLPANFCARDRKDPRFEDALWVQERDAAPLELEALGKELTTKHIAAHVDLGLQPLEGGKPNAKIEVSIERRLRKPMISGR